LPSSCRPVARAADCQSGAIQGETSTYEITTRQTPDSGSNTYAENVKPARADLTNENPGATAIAKALGWATIALVIGGLVSAVVLLLAAPQLAAFALNFGPIETFALVFLGMTCIVSVSSGSLVKGLLAGSIGIFLASVGGDPVTGQPRM
jgi:hypothetical protein